jgi:hypothetical protein
MKPPKFEVSSVVFPKKPNGKIEVTLWDKTNKAFLTIANNKYKVVQVPLTKAQTKRLAQNAAPAQPVPPPKKQKKNSPSFIPSPSPPSQTLAPAVSTDEQPYMPPPLEDRKLKASWEPRRQFGQ